MSMKKMIQTLGRVAFYVGWPVMFLYLFPSRRTRVVILCHDEVLLVKGWIGSGKWHLPGGGLHRGEDPLEGAVREVREEAGITIQKSDLQPLFTKRISNDQKHRFTVYAYVVRLDKRPGTSQRPLEIAELAWRKVKDVVNDPRATSNTRMVVGTISEGKKP